MPRVPPVPLPHTELSSNPGQVPRGLSCTFLHVVCTLKPEGQGLQCPRASLSTPRAIPASCPTGGAAIWSSSNVGEGILAGQ